MNQEVRFCTGPDDVRLAYSVVGEGPVLVKTANWLTHLDFDWDSPIWRDLFFELARTHRLVRYDGRGNGLSDHDATDISFETMVQDLETVVDAAGIDRFSLLGISQGGAVSVAYAVRHPERVERLVLLGGYARGWAKRGDSTEIEVRRALQTLMREAWGRKNPAFRQVWASLYLPDGTSEQMEWFRELQQRSTTAEHALRILNATSVIDVRDLLPRVTAPTLVLHAHDDGAVPFAEGRALAAGIPGARFAVLESRNHLLLRHEPAFHEFLRQVREFLGVSAPPHTAPTVETPPQRLGPYRLLRRIGAGGSGQVWRAEDERLERTVAIKMLHPSIARDPVAQRRLLREARALAALDHPNVASVFGYEEEAGRPFLVMGFVEGETLATLVREAPLPAERVLPLASQMLHGLGAAHGRGVIHRDLKPGNVMVTPSDVVKLVDFGLADASEESTLTPAGYVVGTPAYMAPEQALGVRPTAQSDLFSVGVILYELLTGRRPFQRETMAATLAAIVQAEPAAFDPSLPETTRRLEPVVLRALTKDPEGRHASAEAFRCALEDAGGERGGTPPV